MAEFQKPLTLNSIWAEDTANVIFDDQPLAAISLNNVGESHGVIFGCREGGVFFNGYIHDFVAMKKTL